MSVKISDSDGSSAQATSTATIADAALSAHGAGSPTKPVPTTPAFTGSVASFTDQNPAATASDFTATIDWGDGTNAAGTVTGSSGSYRVSGAHSYAAGGPHTVQVQIADRGGSTAGATASLLVYEYADHTGGSFVIGDRVPGPQVYFWGERWARHNPMSGARSARGFAGFAEASTQSCGSTFVARRGERSEAPASVPSYMTVAVTSGVSRSHHHQYGTVVKIVVVKTVPGYRPHSDTPGTGQIVATICG